MAARDEDEIALNVNGDDIAAAFLLTSTECRLTDESINKQAKFLNQYSNIRIPLTTKTLRKRAEVDDSFLKIEMCGGCKRLYYEGLPERCGNVTYEDRVCGRVAREAIEPVTHCAYKSIKVGITQLISNIDNFFELCQAWKRRDAAHHIGDIYEGDKWESFLPWLNEHGYTSLLLQLNIDWFNPYSNGPHSSGAIYVSILNLPREIRYHEENVLLICCIPGPAEPSKGELNEIIKLVVDDLELAQDFLVGEKRMRVRLFNCVSDLPATRAFCGLAGHSANQGCSRCDSDLNHGEKEKIGSRKNHLQHMAAARRIRSSDNLTQKKQISKDTGFKDAEILRLAHFKPVHDHVIDTMHNLCSGIGRNLKSLCNPDYNKVREALKSAGASTELIHKIHTGLTSSQVKDVYDLYSHCFMGAVSDRKLQLIYLLKNIMASLMARCLTIADLDTADERIREWLTKFVRVFGENALTPNMHMMLHITDDIKRFGPSPSNWCFPYERYNRTLKNTTTNHHDIAIQVMRHQDQLSQLTRTKTVTISPRLKPEDRERMLSMAPLMSLDMAEGVVMVKQKRKRAVPLDIRRAVHEFMSERNVPAITSLSFLKELSIYGEVVCHGDCVFLKERDIILEIQHIILVNSVYVALAGHEFFDMKTMTAGGKIKTWQFKSGIITIGSPLGILTKATVSSKLVRGVRMYTSELRSSKYAY